MFIINNTFLGALFIFFSAVLWSAIGLVIKSTTSSVAWTVIIRSLAAWIVFCPFIFKIKISPLKSLIKTGVCFSLFIYFFITTTRLGSAALAVSMQYTAPLYAIIYMFYREKKVTLNKIPPLAFIGIGIFLNVFDASGDTPLIAMLSGIFIGIIFLLYSSSMKSIQTGSALGIVSAVNLIAVAILLLVLPFDFHPTPPSFNEVFVLIMAGIVISGLSYIFYGIGLRKIPLELAMIISMAEPVLNPIWVYFGTKEVPEPLTIIGLLCILTGGLIDITMRILYNKNVERQEQ